METYLVTGAAGFIGSRVCEMLLEEGAQVVGIDNLNDYYSPALKEYRVKCLLAGLPLDSGEETTSQKRRRPGFEFQNIDIENKGELAAVFSRHRFSTVFNLAARAGVRYSIENPTVYMTTNALGTLNILECQRDYKVDKMVLASTSSLYAGCPMPFSENQPVNTPLSPYAASKKSAEVMAYAYHKEFGIDVSIVRYFTVFGPAGRPDMSYFRFIQSIAAGRPITVYGDGSQTRDFTYIDDIARGTIMAGKKLGYEIINLGGGRRPLTLSYMIQLIAALVDRPPVIEWKDFLSVDMLDTQADIAKAKRLLDWEPSSTVEEGLLKTVAWHKRVGGHLGQI